MLTMRVDEKMAILMKHYEQMSHTHELVIKKNNEVTLKHKKYIARYDNILKGESIIFFTVTTAVRYALIKCYHNPAKILKSQLFQKLFIDFVVKIASSNFYCTTELIVSVDFFRVIE